MTFTKTGFRDWKHAKEKKKGFHQHKSSNDHLRATEIYEEREMRKLRGCTVVASLVLPNTDYAWAEVVCRFQRIKIFMCKFPSVLWHE